MDLIWQKFTEWLKELLISGIMDNVNGLFDNVNSRVAGIAGQVGATPQGWNSGVYGMIRTLSDNTDSIHSLKYNSRYIPLDCHFC